MMLEYGERVQFNLTPEQADMIRVGHLMGISGKIIKIYPERIRNLGEFDCVVLFDVTDNGINTQYRCMTKFVHLKKAEQ